MRAWANCRAGAVPAPIKARNRARSASLRHTASFVFLLLRVPSFVLRARRLHQRGHTVKSLVTHY
jgi:uncharacterized membrane protein YhaH (DUF805 family)